MAKRDEEVKKKRREQWHGKHLSMFQLFLDYFKYSEIECWTK